MTLRLALLGVFLAGWIAAASSVLMWFWPFAVAASLMIGWYISKVATKAGASVYALVFGLPLAVAGSLFLWFNVVSPDPGFGQVVGVFALVHLAALLAAFAFVRHVITVEL